jgi:hypothetical protein
MFKHLLNFVRGEQGSITQLAGRVSSSGKGYSPLKRPASILAAIVLLSLLAGACAPPGGSTASSTPTNGTTTSGGPGPSFPTTPPHLRTPTFATTGQEAPTVKVLASVDPTLIIQFPLVPSGIKRLFPNAKGLVTVFQNPNANDFDTVTLGVQNMPPNVKFTVFFTEIATKPFGHAEYVGDLITRGDGTGESVFHLITFVSFAADNRNPGTSTDQSGDASGIQLEHVGMWFDGLSNARKVLNDPTVAGTPFDGGGGALHAGPQAMTDGQTLPVI